MLLASKVTSHSRNSTGKPLSRSSAPFRAHEEATATSHFVSTGEPFVRKSRPLWPDIASRAASHSRNSANPPSSRPSAALRPLQESNTTRYQRNFDYQPFYRTTHGSSNEGREVRATFQLISAEPPPYVEHITLNAPQEASAASYWSTHDPLSYTDNVQAMGSSERKEDSPPAYESIFQPYA